MVLHRCFCCRHKRKVQRFLPCKTSHRNNCDGQIATYDEPHDGNSRPTPTHHHHHPAGHIVAPSIEVCYILKNKIKIMFSFEKGWTRKTFGNVNK